MGTSVSVTSLVVIDGDIIGYKCAAASEQRTIQVVHKQSQRTKQFKTRTEFKSWLKEQDKWEELDFEIEDVQAPEPIENCLHSVKRMIENIHNASGCKEFKVVVQGEGNFRDNLLLPTRYKSNRDDMLKPVHLKETKHYLQGKYNAELSVNRESDDVLASYAWEGYTNKQRIVAATVDKDAKQQMGWLFNWDKMTEPTFIKGLGELFINSKGKAEGFGRKWLVYQAAVGDSSDCYKPTELTKFKYGDKAAVKDFGDLKTDKECWQKLANLYQTWYPESFTYVAWNGVEMQADWMSMMQLYVDAAHMQRFENDRVMVKNVLAKMEII